ncbi:MAG: CBS domain-containing protein [Bacteroidetes bacterium]|nr:CBS domain-containing protein [Bacteroidota bacterium]HET6245508.1 CBS domain-containing protein [Bacteroidia bacterium]
MLAKNLITHDIPPLKTSDTGLKALTWMEEFKVSHMPIVNNVDFLGMISDADILDMNAPEEAIGTHNLSLSRPFVYENEHIYEVIKLIYKLNLTLLPVLDKDNRFLGTISMNQLIKSFAEMSAIKDPGGIVVLEMNPNDFTLSEIARIVEGNDGKILSSYITSSVDSNKLEVTLKINRTDLSAILQTFIRYNYTIQASFHQSEFIDEMKDRYDSFMNYLNV